jgi:hypothetical protein
MCSCVYASVLTCVRKQNRLIELNKRLSDAMQMYHALMKETPMYGGYSNKYPPPPTYTMVQQQQPDATVRSTIIPPDSAACVCS